MPLLNGTLTLHAQTCRSHHNQACTCRPIRDVEGLCRHTLNKGLARTQTTLTPAAYEDALAELITIAWQLSQRYDPAKDKAVQTGARKPDLDGYASNLLKLRVVDAANRSRGRTRWQFADHTYERELPTLLSLNTPDENGDTHDPAAPDHHSTDPLEFAQRTRNGDPLLDCDPDLYDTLDRRRRQGTRHINLRRPSTPRRAA